MLTNNLLFPSDIVVVALETVTEPPERADTSKPVPKSIVPAVPTIDPLFLIAIPVPEPVTPVSPEPSPTNLDAVTIPVNVAFPIDEIVAAVPILNPSE